jgi:hypothetical protein
MVAAKSCHLVPTNSHDDQESTLPVAEMDFDVDADDSIDSFCLNSALPRAKGQGVLIAALVTSVSHELIYALQNLRI